MRTGLLVAAAALLAGARLAAQDKPAAPAPAIKPSASTFVIADCTAFKDRKLTVRFRWDENFDRYVAARFTYPKNEAKGAEAGKTYVFTFSSDEAAHTSKGVTPVDEANPPKDLNDHQMIGRAVAVDEKSVVVEFVRDENLKRFYAREQTFSIWNDRAFAAGQVLKISFGPDNRHCKGYAVLEDGRKDVK